MNHPDINYFAVLVAGIVIFALGAAWYSPVLFSKRWIALQGRTEEELRAAGANTNMPLAFLSVFIGGLLTALIMAMLFAHIAQTMPLDPWHGAFFGFLCWLGFAGATSYGSYLFSMKPKGLWLIDSGYNLVSFVLAGIILAVWR